MVKDGKAGGRGEREKEPTGLRGRAGEFEVERKRYGEMKRIRVNFKKRGREGKRKRVRE